MQKDKTTSGRHRAFSLIRMPNLVNQTVPDHQRPDLRQMASAVFKNTNQKHNRIDTSCDLPLLCRSPAITQSVIK
ncbi:hypothetical protein Pla22_06420 [Rubripirellula amarantea]|uniref:Uncharacterized protein n=1 Tax=Rubripirellula amarantea TaxID=2527999 RepID=A0A5C5WQ54_9BACT|nr:hypothetical protein Pla22_06420 [Rubripirellula amarantea]